MSITNLNSFLIKNINKKTILNFWLANPIVKYLIPNNIFLFIIYLGELIII